MKKNLLTLLLCVLGTHELVHAQANDPSPVGFYKSLTRDIESAQGNLVLDFTGGLWKTKYNGVSLLWNIEDGAYATITFKYESRVMKQVTIVFSPAIHVATVGPKNLCASLSVTTLSYVDGRLKSNDAKMDTRQCNSPRAWDVLQNFELDPTTNALFTGKLLPNTVSAILVDEKGNRIPTDHKMIRKVGFERRGEGDPGLLVVFANHAVLDFSKANGKGLYSNYVRVLPTSHFEFDLISYNLETKYLRGKLFHLDFLVENGSFATADCQFLMSNGSSLKFDNIEFEYGVTEKYIHLAGGTFDGYFSQNSTLTVEKGGSPIPDKIDFADNTVVNLKDFEVTIDETTGTKVDVGNGSMFDINILSAHLDFGKDGYVDLSNGNIKMEIVSGVWEKRVKPNLYANVLNLNVNVSNGLLLFASANKIVLTGGLLKATNLTLRSDASPVLTGVFTQCSLTIGDYSVFGIPNGLQVLTAAGGSISSFNIEFEKDFAYPLGDFHIKLPFRKFGNTDRRQFALLDGTFETDINNSMNSITGTNTVIDGVMRFNINMQGANGVAALNLKLDDASFLYKDNVATFKGMLQGSGSLHISANIGTNYAENIPVEDKDVHEVCIFPIALTLSIDEDNFAIPRKEISFEGSKVAMEIELHPTIYADIHSGNGEYVNRHKLSDGTDSGDDELGHLQELVVADYDGPAFLNCTVHGYLMPKRHGFKTKIVISAKPDGTPTLSLSELVLDHPFVIDQDFKKDGCDVGPFLTIAGAIIGGAFFGGFGFVGGAWLGNHFGDSLEDKVAAMASQRISEKVQSFSRSWDLQR